LRLKYYTHRTRCPKGQELIFVFHICLAFIFLSNVSFFFGVASLLKSTVGQRRPSQGKQTVQTLQRRNGPVLCETYRPSASLYSSGTASAVPDVPSVMGVPDVPGTRQTADVANDQMTAGLCTGSHPWGSDPGLRCSGHELARTGAK